MSIKLIFMLILIQGVGTAYADTQDQEQCFLPEKWMCE